MVSINLLLGWHKNNNHTSHKHLLSVTFPGAQSRKISIFPTVHESITRAAFDTSVWEKLMLSMSEKELGKKWDRCLADGAIKLGTGLGLGIVFSVLFFKRHTWPISFGSGTGLGMAYANCQNDLRSHYLLHRSEKEQ